MKKRPGRGCCLSCCLLYLMIPAFLGVLFAITCVVLLSTHFKTELLATIRSFQLPLVPLPSLKHIAPLLIMLLFGITGLICLLDFVCVFAIWRWKRWGVYVLFAWLALPVIASIAGLFDGAPFASTLRDIFGILLGYLIPYGVLLLLLRRVWKYMD